MKKIYVHAPGENWILDRYAEEWKTHNPDLVTQVPYRSLPKLNIKTSTGIGGFVRPIMSNARRAPQEVIQVIDCYSH